MYFCKQKYHLFPNVTPLINWKMYTYRFECVNLQAENNVRQCLCQWVSCLSLRNQDSVCCVFCAYKSFWVQCCCHSASATHTNRLGLTVFLKEKRKESIVRSFLTAPWTHEPVCRLLTHWKKSLQMPLSTSLHWHVDLSPVKINACDLSVRE